MSEKKQARLAFIGAGGFATSSIYPNIHRVPEIDLVAVCDIDREKAEKNARDFGAQRVYTDLHEMLDNEELDGVFCIGSAPQQYELAPNVLKRGLPVYVEKPSANTSAEARELAEMATAHDTWGQVGFMKRFAHVYMMAKRILENQEFGELHMVKCKFAQGPYPQIWGIDSAKRSMLIGQLCHIFDLVRYFGGNPKTVHSFYKEVTPTQFAYSVNVEFEHGAIGQLDLNGLEHKSGFRDIKERLELVGLETHLICDDMMRLHWQERDDFSGALGDVGRYVKSFDPSWIATASSERMLGYWGEVNHFAMRCLGEVDWGPDLWDSYHSLRFGEAVYQSVEEQRVVELQG